MPFQYSGLRPLIDTILNGYGVTGHALDQWWKTNNADLGNKSPNQIYEQSDVKVYVYVMNKYRFKTDRLL